MGGLRALATAALYLVLKSNGLRHPKNPPVKFGFSSNSVPANIVQKLSAHSLLKSVFFRISTSLTNAPRSLSQAKVGTHSAFRERSHTAAYTPKQGAFRTGVVSLLSACSARSPTSPGRVSERQVLPLLGLGHGCSQRTQRAFGTAMRLCASLFRGVAAPLGCVIFFRFCRNYGFHTLCSRLSACARHRRYHYPRRALRAAETPDGRLSKRLICRFLRSGGRSSPHDFYFLANTQNFLLAVPVANAFALWYDKFSKLEID